MVPCHNLQGTLKACLDTRFPMQMALFFPFQNGGKVISTAEAVAQRNGPIFAKKGLRACLDTTVPFRCPYK